MNSINRDYSEKRDFIRMKVDTEITLSFEGSGQSMKAICKDLSGTGMLIETEEALSIGKEFYTSLPSNNEAFPSFNTLVRVVRCEIQNNEKYLVGTEILKISS